MGIHGCICNFQVLTLLRPTTTSPRREEPGDFFFLSHHLCAHIWLCFLIFNTRYLLTSRPLVRVLASVQPYFLSASLPPKTFSRRPPISTDLRVRLSCSIPVWFSLAWRRILYAQHLLSLELIHPTMHLSSTLCLAAALGSLATATRSSKRGLVFVPSANHPSDNQIWVENGSDLTW